MRLYSFNVNGVRAAAKKGLLDWLDEVRPDVLCLQETKADPAVLPDDLVHPRGYHGHWTAAEKKGYSGVATLCRTPPASWRAGFGVQRFDSEGRVVVTDMGDFDLYNVYFPNGRSGAERLGYKMEFYAAFLDHINERLRAGRPVIFCGDVNTAHREIDLARPRENRKTSGFMPEECAALDLWLEHGWVDTFRHLYPEVTESYSWWDQRMNARVRNVGWRIDYFFVPNTLLDRVKDAGICPEVMGSDHCPVWLELRD